MNVLPSSKRTYVKECHSLMVEMCIFCVVKISVGAVGQIKTRGGIVKWSCHVDVSVFIKTCCRAFGCLCDVMQSQNSVV